jgi:hypothetical protein
LLKDICREAAERGRLDERSERAHVAVALGAAVVGQPHKTAMGVLDAAGSMRAVRAQDGRRRFVQVKGSGGDLYNTYGGYCSCKYSEKHAERNGFFKARRPASRVLCACSRLGVCRGVGCVSHRPD